MDTTRAVLSRSVVASVLWLSLSVSGVVAASLTGEWTATGDSERRLTLMADGAFELALSGRSAQARFFTVTLEMASETSILGYGVTPNSLPGYEPVDPSARVHQFSAPIDTYRQALSGVWSTTDSSLHLLVTGFGISQVDEVPTTEYVRNLLEKELETASLDDETRRALTAALDKVRPISISQDEPLEELVWEIEANGDQLAVNDPNGEFTGDWSRTMRGTAVARSGWASVKARMSDR